MRYMVVLRMVFVVILKLVIEVGVIVIFVSVEIGVIKVLSVDYSWGLLGWKCWNLVFEFLIILFSFLGLKMLLRVVRCLGLSGCVVFLVYLLRVFV